MLRKCKACKRNEPEADYINGDGYFKTCQKCRVRRIGKKKDLDKHNYYWQYRKCGDCGKTKHLFDFMYPIEKIFKTCEKCRDYRKARYNRLKNKNVT